MSSQAPDQVTGTSEYSILLPGDEPQGVQDTAPSQPSVSPAGDEENMRAALEAAGVKPAESAPTSSPIDPQLLEALRKLDPTQLPEDVVKHLDRHFQPDYTRKTQALAEKERAFEQQRNQWMDRMEQLVARVGTAREQPSDRNQMQDIRERLRAGDFEAVESYVDQQVQQRVAPLESTVALRTAYESAEAAEPLLKQNAEAVGQLIRENPDLVGLITVQNHKFAPIVFQALARDVEFRKAQQVIASFENQKRDAVMKGIEAYKARVMGLPQQTSHAGTSSGTPPQPASPKTFDEARAKTLADLKGMGIV